MNQASADETKQNTSSASSAVLQQQTKENLVKWLYPKEFDEEVDAMADAGEKRTDGQEEKKDKISPENSMDKDSVDSCVTNDEDAAGEDEIDVAEITEEITKQVTAGTKALGSMFNTAWSKTQKAADSGMKASTSLFNFAAGYDLNKPSDDEDDEYKAAAEAEKAPSASAAGVPKSQSFFGTGFTSAWSKVSDMTSSAVTKSTSWTSDLSKAATADKDEFKEGEEIKEEEEGTETSAGGGLFGGLGSGLGAGIGADLTSLVKVATDATTAIKAKVSQHATILTEFNKEQENFIKNKVSDESTGGVAPWVGYEDEDVLEAMKAKILSLSVDKRTFVRAPPTGVTFDFDYSSVSSVARALLTEDPNLQKMRYELVPKVVKEDEFWRNYFYRVNLIKQSFDLKDFEESEVQRDRGSVETPESRLAPPDDEFLNKDTAGGDNDEFVSDSYQVSSQDMAEVNESMKRLGVSAAAASGGGGGGSGGGDVNDDEWEAELEGELNEFEVVSSTGGREDSPEWENQIQEMLDAEEKSTATSK